MFSIILPHFEILSVPIKISGRIGWNQIVFIPFPSNNWLHQEGFSKKRHYRFWDIFTPLWIRLDIVKRMQRYKTVLSALVQKDARTFLFRFILLRQIIKTNATWLKRNRKLHLGELWYFPLKMISIISFFGHHFQRQLTDNFTRFHSNAIWFSRLDMMVKRQYCFVVLLPNETTLNYPVT